MGQIPTAEEFLSSKQYNWVEDINTTECMIEFAKLHVEAALNKVWDKSSEWDNGFNNPIRVIDNFDDAEELILETYPLENIK